MNYEYISISLLCTVLGLAISYAVFSRQKAKADKSEGRQDGVVLTEIGYIKSGIDDIKLEQREQRKTNNDLRERMAKVEASALQAHHRLDILEKGDHYD